MSWGVYVHAPWCARRCPYCAFATSVHRDPPWQAWAEAVVREHALRAPLFEGLPVSVYLGGGTPSQAPAPVLSWLLERLPRAAGAEVSIEVNPEDADPAWLSAVVDAGVDRISLGVQTLHPRYSRLLGRRARPDACRRAAERVAALPLRSWSVDLMFALPGQSVAEVLDDGRALLDLGAPHLSLYGLTWEEGTPYSRGLAKGILHPVEDEAWREMYEGLWELLEGRGLLRYEVSNAARPGHESVHNQLYWSDQPYMGLGPSAHGFAPDGRRWVNRAEVEAWQVEPVERWEQPTPRQRAVDALVSCLRGREGVELGRLGLEVAPAAVARLEMEGLVVVEGGRLRLGDRGWPLVDAVTRFLANSL